MKFKFFLAVLFTAIAVTTGWNFNQSENEIKISDLALANIDALAINENVWHEGCTWRTGHSSLSGWIAICDNWGVGNSCTCGDHKNY